MDYHGLTSGFFVCKIGVALAAMSLIGAALVTSSSAKNTAEREELGAVADAIADAIRTADGLPGEVRLERRLPITHHQFNVEIAGTRDGTTQVVRVRVIAAESVERTLMIANRLEGGTFGLSRGAPTMLRLHKLDGISLELV